MMIPKWPALSQTDVKWERTKLGGGRSISLQTGNDLKGMGLKLTKGNLRIR